MVRRTITADEKRVVGARQGWRCSACGVLLSSAYEVDHTVPLFEGGEDTLDNTTAMCPNCHALKSQRERMRPWRAADAYDTREDTFGGGRATCTLCGISRPETCTSHICSEIETPGARARAIRVNLSRFAYQKRAFNI